MLATRQGGDGLQGPPSRPPKQFEGAASLGNLPGGLDPGLARHVRDRVNRIDHGVGVKRPQHVFDLVEEGFDLFASSGHDTKVRRQRARRIGGRIKVTRR